MKLYKDSTKGTYSFLLKDTTLTTDNPLRPIIKWLSMRKSKPWQIEGKKPLYNLVKQTAKISALSSGNIGK